MRTYRVAILPGDGIGPEVVDITVRALAAVQEKAGTYRLELSIAGVNALPKTKTLEITVTGDWYDDQQEMFRDGVRIRLLD